MKKLTVFCVCFLLTAICGAEIITVDDDAPADFSNIQAAINDSNDGDIIEVRPGTYTGDGNRDIDPNGKAVTIRSIDPNDPNIVTATIIDCNGTEAEPHRGFYFHSGEDSNSILDGLTITNGYVILRPESSGRGGGILCEQACPTIKNCIIMGNLADSGGAGMYNYLSNPTINSCTFYNNHVFGCILTGGGGGGMCNSHSSPTVTNCTFRENSGTCGAGGMANYWEDSSPTVTNCTFTNNNDAGMGNSFGSSPVLIDCIFSHNLNSFVGMGGGMYCDGNLVLTNCIFIGNSAETGGGVLSSSSLLMLTNCIFCANSAENRGGGLSIYDSNSTTLVNCTFAGNSAHNGNALACDSDQQMFPSNIQVTNSILWDGGSEIWNNDGSTIILAYTNIEGGWSGLGNIDTDPCFVQPGYWDANGTPEDANDDFWVNGDYHLKSEGWRWVAPEGNWTWDNITSRCIDAGNPGSPLGDELPAIPRDPDNLYGRNLRINMGAYGGTAEASIPPHDWAILGDLTNDWVVDVNDLAVFADYWLDSGDCIPSDLNRNGSVQFDDFAIFAEDW